MSSPPRTRTRARFAFHLRLDVVGPTEGHLIWIRNHFCPATRRAVTQTQTLLRSMKRLPAESSLRMRNPAMRVQPPPRRDRPVHSASPRDQFLRETDASI